MPYAVIIPTTIMVIINISEEHKSSKAQAIWTFWNGHVSGFYMF